MFSFSKPIQAGVMVCALLAFSWATVSGADRKVTRASHEGQKEEQRQPAATTLDTTSEPAAKSAPNSDNDSTFSYSPDWPEPPDTGAMLMRLVFGTVTVLVLCVGTLVFGKPWLKRLQIKGTMNPAFHVEGSVVVGQRAMLHLVRVGGVQLVAGTDASGLKSLVVIPTPFKDVLDDQMTEPEAAPVANPDPLDLRSIQRSISKESGHVELR